MRRRQLSAGQRPRPTGRRRGFVASAALLALASGLASCGSSKAAGSAPAVPTTLATNRAAASTTADTRYFLDLALADPALSSYVNGRSRVALQALLADGVGLCEVLDRGGDIDQAMISVAQGADGVESRTHLPRSVRTFNAIDAAALLALCPGDQRRLPPSDQSTLRTLAQAIAASQGG